MAAQTAKPDPRLPALMKLARLAEERECAALARLGDRIAALRAAHAAAGHLPAGDLWQAGFAQVGGIDGWARAATVRRKRINAELASLLAEEPALRDRAKTALARRLALEKLVEKGNGGRRVD